MQLTSCAIIIIYLSLLVYLTLIEPALQQLPIATNSSLMPGMFITSSSGMHGTVKTVLDHSVIITRTDGLIVEVLKKAITSIHNA